MSYLDNKIRIKNSSDNNDLKGSKTIYVPNDKILCENCQKEEKN